MAVNFNKTQKAEVTEKKLTLKDKIEALKNKTSPTAKNIPKGQSGKKKPDIKADIPAESKEPKAAVFDKAKLDAKKSSYDDKALSVKERAELWKPVAKFEPKIQPDKTKSEKKRVDIKADVAASHKETKGSIFDQAQPEAAKSSWDKTQLSVKERAKLWDKKIEKKGGFAKKIKAEREEAKNNPKLKTL